MLVQGIQVEETADTISIEVVIVFWADSHAQKIYSLTILSSKMSQAKSSTFTSARSKLYLEMLIIAKISEKSLTEATKKKLNLKLISFKWEI